MTKKNSVSRLEKNRCLVEFIPIVVVRVVFFVIVVSVLYFTGKRDGVLQFPNLHRDKICSLSLSNELLDAVLLKRFESGDFDRQNCVVGIEKLAKDQHVRVRKKSPELSIVENGPEGTVGVLDFDDATSGDVDLDSFDDGFLTVDRLDNFLQAQWSCCRQKTTRGLVQDR